MGIFNFRKPGRWTLSGVLKSLCSIICGPWILCVLAYVWTENGATHTSSYIYQKWRATDLSKKKEAKKNIIAVRRAYEEVLEYKITDGQWTLTQYPSKGQERLRRAMENKSKPKGPWGHSDSGFCKLPTEIRLRIYEMVIGQVVLEPHAHKTVAPKRRSIHIHKHLSRRTLFGFPCIYDGPISKRWNTKLCQCRHEHGDWLERPNVLHYQHSQLGIGMIPLALSCRFIGDEVLDWIYTWPTFVFHRPETALLFFFMLPPKYRDRVRNIYVDGRGAHWTPPFTAAFECMPRVIRNRKDLRHYKSVWPAVQTLLSDARGLRQVSASLCDLNFRLSPLEQRARLALEPLISLKKARGEDLKVEVEVDWDEGGENSDVERELLRNGAVLKRVDRSRVPDLEGTNPVIQELINGVYGDK